MFFSVKLLWWTSGPEVLSLEWRRPMDPSVLTFYHHVNLLWQQLSFFLSPQTKPSCSLRLGPGVWRRDQTSFRVFSHAYKNLSVHLTWPGGQMHYCWEAWSEVQLLYSLLPTADVGMERTSPCTHTHTAGQHTHPGMIRVAQKRGFSSRSLCVFSTQLWNTHQYLVMVRGKMGDRKTRDLQL